MKYLEKAFIDKNLEVVSCAEPLEEVIDKMKGFLRSQHIDRLRVGDCSIEAISSQNRFWDLISHSSFRLTYVPIYRRDRRLCQEQDCLDCPREAFDFAQAQSSRTLLPPLPWSPFLSEEGLYVSRCVRGGAEVRGGGGFYNFSLVQIWDLFSQTP